MAASFGDGRIGGDVVAETANRSYRLLVPEAVEKDARLPIVIYLHGAGAKGSDNRKPEAEPLPAYLASEAFQKAHPCYVLVPQCRDGSDAEGRPNNWVKWKGQKDLPPAQWVGSDTEPSDQLHAAMTALDEIMEKHAIDPARVYLTGVSMGASGSWNWAARQPGRFAAVLPVCGLSEEGKAEVLKPVKIRTYHGSGDEMVPVDRSRRMITALKALGADADLTEYTGAGHDIAGKVLADGAMEWLFSQRAGTPAAGKPVPDEQGMEFFEKEIRPLLAEHCYECHGEKKQKGELRLDTRAAAFAGGELGKAIVPGDLEKSLLITAVRYHDKDLQMPPEEKLPQDVVAKLESWILGGAPWPDDGKSHTTKVGGEMVFSAEMKDHWAFQPMKKPPVPASAANAIDHFISGKLTGNGLALSPEAEPRKLIRRLALDITGLPPTPEETEAFVADHSPEAYQALVKRLLASPRYGERWGRHWLDVARYADSNGSEVDHAMANAWRYRDYIIRSFNSDKPFDRFLREQIAGDLLPDKDDDSLTATGFLMLGPKALADLDKARLTADVIDEQVDTVSRAFIGMTMGCARCHDHKFDPLSAADYYAMSGIFSSTKTMDVSKRVATWTERPLGGNADLEKYASLGHEIAELRKQREAIAKSGGGKERKALASGTDYLVVEAEHFTSGNVSVESDSLGRGIGVIRTRTEYPDHIEYEFELPEEGDYQIELRYAAKESRPTQLLVNGNLETEEAAAEITGDWTPRAQRWFVQGTYRFRKGTNVLAFHRDGPVPIFDKWIIGRPRAQAYSETAPEAKAGFAMEDDGRKERLKEMDAAIAKAEDRLSAMPRVMVPLEGTIADAPILVRGNPATPGAVVPRGFPKIVTNVNVAGPGPAASGREELAAWLAHPDHPLTARVIVNRVWLWHFGEGLVRSPDNFGLRGETPSHPELLDWLAVWFVENGWSLKKLHELILSSATYRQAVLTKAPAQDPENRLFSGFPRRRLEAEVLRDSMLAISGRLDAAMGGSLMTVQDRTYANGGNAPADITNKMNYGSSRRSVYVPIIRNALYDFFSAFDYPNPGVITGQRAQTTVAPQALFLMNSPFVLEQSAALAGRIEGMDGDDAARVRAAWQLVLSRPARSDEIDRSLAYVNALEEDLRRLGDGSPRRSAWTRMCQTLFASNEFLYLQ